MKLGPTWVVFAASALVVAGACSDESTDPGGNGGSATGTGTTTGTPSGTASGTSTGTGTGTGSATSCDEADTYDTDCATATSGQWCWDGGTGGELFCGCDPEFGNVDCQQEGYGLCNPDTNVCEATPDCGADANEDNNTEATATALTLGTPISGATCGFDEDWFTFTADNTAALVTATWTNDGETDLDLVITDCNGSQLGSGVSGDPAQESTTATGLTSGTDYCVLVAYYSGASGGADPAYSVSVEGRTACVLDSQCTGGEVCGVTGSEAGVCSSTTPPAAGCGDDASGDNDTSGLAEPLTSGTPITEGSCDGNPDNPPDFDWFTFTLAAGQSVSLTVDQASGMADGDIDVYLYDSNGVLWAAAATVNNPEVIAGSGLPAGTYYVMTYYYDNDPATPASTTYDITLTLTAGSGCADRDDCAAFIQHGECTANVCVNFPGNGAQGPGDFCDDSSDCDPNTTGSQFTSNPCFTADPALGTDNVCVIDCTQESDCTAYGMHCGIVSAPDGICLAPCASDAGCGGGTCDVGTGICNFN